MHWTFASLYTIFYLIETHHILPNQSTVIWLRSCGTILWSNNISFRHSEFWEIVIKEQMKLEHRNTTIAIHFFSGFLRNIFCGFYYCMRNYFFLLSCKGLQSAMAIGYKLQWNKLTWLRIGSVFTVWEEGKKAKMEII